MLLRGLRSALQASSEHLPEVLQQQELMLSFKYIHLAVNQHTKPKNYTN